LGFPVEAGAYDELASSAIAEVGNIMCCSYINALSSLLGFKVEVSVPEVSRDMVGSLLSVPIIYFADHSDNLLLIEDRYFIDDQSIVSHVLFLPNLESLKRIFSAVGEPYGR
jgi:chemotaxis protein CheC